MTITMHLCRGNFRSTFMGTGGYEPVAELLFNTINVHGYFLEYDTDRAGGFEPLRFVPKGKLVVLGLVTTKAGKLEAKDEIKRSIKVGRAPTGLELPRLALPEIDEPGEIARYLLSDGLPGEFPFLNGAYREMYLEPLHEIEIGSYSKSPNGSNGQSVEAGVSPASSRIAADTAAATVVGIDSSPDSRLRVSR